MSTATVPNASPSPWAIEPIVLREICDEIPDVLTFEFSFAQESVANRYRARPGQFNMLYCPGYGEAAISLSRIDCDSRRLIHTVRAAGDVTNALTRLEPGQTVGCRGPFGNGWPELGEDVGSLVIVGGGIGMAPLRPVIENVLSEDRPDRELTVLIGARHCEHLLFQSEYQSWRDRGATVIATVDRSSPDWEGNVGVVPALIDRLPIHDPTATHVFACGPEIMMSYSAMAAVGRDVPPENIWFSMERHMNCAIGHCGRCQFGSHFVCTGGPVFRYPDIKKLISIHGL